MTTLVLVGDIHGDFVFLNEVMQRAPDDAKIIQVGDFGYWPSLRPHWEAHVTSLHPVYFIDGNHDYITGLNVHGDQPEIVWDGRAIYVPRGVVLQINEVKILFCGGSKSLDRHWRTENSLNHGWFEDEQLTDADVERAITNVERMNGVNLMITHAPPDDVIRRNFSDHGLKSFGHNPQTWVDESAKRVQRLHEELGKPPLVCGHMHRSLVDGNVRVLDINEVSVLEL